jgi:hypothetical protein
MEVFQSLITHGEKNNSLVSKECKGSIGRELFFKATMQNDGLNASVV